MTSRGSRFPIPGKQFSIPARQIPDSPGLISDSLRLVAITDDIRDGRDGLVDRASRAVRGGATMVQLRLRDIDARELVDIARALVRALPVPVLVNSRADVALAAGAAGVHLGI